MDNIEFRARPMGGDFHLFADHGGALLTLIGSLTHYRGDLIFTSADDELQEHVAAELAPDDKMSAALAKVKASYLRLSDYRRREAEAEQRAEGAYERMMDAWASQDRLDLELHDSLHPDGYASPYFEHIDWGSYDGLEDCPPVP